MTHYAIATLVVRGRGGAPILSVAFGTGDKKILVELKALDKIKRLFPEGDGWSEHQVVAEPISEKFMLEPLES